jgi:hypothetical protein
MTGVSGKDGESLNKSLGFALSPLRFGAAGAILEHEGAAVSLY